MIFLLLYILVKLCFRNWDSDLSVFKYVFNHSSSTIQYLLFICRFRRDLITDNMSDFICQSQLNHKIKSKNKIPGIPLSYIKHIVLSNTSFEIDSYEFIKSNEHCDIYKIKVLQSKELISLTLTIINPEIVFYVNIFSHLVYFSSFVLPKEYKLNEMLYIFYDITDATRRVKNMYNLAQIGFNVLNPVYYCKYFIIQPWLNDTISNKLSKNKLSRLYLQLYGIIQNVYMQPTFLSFENKEKINEYSTLLTQQINKTNKKNHKDNNLYINKYIITDCIWYLQEIHNTNIIINSVQTNNILGNIFDRVSNQIYTVMKFKMNSQSNTSLFELYLWNRLYELSNKKELIDVLMILNKFQNYYTLDNIISLLKMTIKRLKMK